MGGWSDDGGRDFIKWMGNLRAQNTLTGALVVANVKFQGSLVELSGEQPRITFTETGGAASLFTSTVKQDGGVFQITATDGETFGNYLLLNHNTLESSFWFGGTNRITFNATEMKPNSGAAGASGSPYTYKGGDYTAAGTDLSGGTATLSGGASTGAGRSSCAIVVYPAGLSGTTENTPVTLMTLAGRATAISANTITIAENTNFVFGTTTGTKIGVTSSDKIGFYSATPIIRPVATLDLGTVLSNLGLRAAGTAYPITTSGTCTLSGQITMGANPINITGATKMYNEFGLQYIRKSASYAMVKGDCGIVGVTDTSAIRYITLPQSNTVASGALVTVKDEGGQAGTFNIFVRNNIGDFIDGVQTSKAISTSYGFVQFYRAASGAWMSI